MKNLGSRIKNLRKQHNLTQLRLGEQLGLSKAIVCAYENGTRQPSFESLVQLSRIFSVSCDYLLGIDPNPSLRSSDIIDLSQLTDEEKNAIINLINVMQKKHR